MMKQKSLAIAADQESGFERYHKPTRREKFLLVPTLCVGTQLWALLRLLAQAAKSGRYLYSPSFEWR